MPRRAEASVAADLVHAPDEEQERRVGLLLLGKGAVLAHGFDHPLAAEMDETEQSPAARGANVLAPALLYMRAPRTPGGRPRYWTRRARPGEGRRDDRFPGLKRPSGHEPPTLVRVVERGSRPRQSRAPASALGPRAKPIERVARADARHSRTLVQLHDSTGVCVLAALACGSRRIVTAGHRTDGSGESDCIMRSRWGTLRPSRFRRDRTSASVG